jgi:hypothetical protein
LGKSRPKQIIEGERDLLIFPIFAAKLTFIKPKMKFSLVLILFFDLFGTPAEAQIKYLSEGHFIKVSSRFQFVEDVSLSGMTENS